MLAYCSQEQATERCFAAEEVLTHHPQMGTVGKREGALAFTFVNVFLMSNLAKSRLRMFTHGSRWSRIDYYGVNALNA